MRKILTAATISVLAIAYTLDPAAIAGGIASTIDFGWTIFGAVTGGLNPQGAPAAPAAGGTVVTLADGTEVVVPPGYEVVPGE